MAFGSPKSHLRVSTLVKQILFKGVAFAIHPSSSKIEHWPARTCSITKATHHYWIPPLCLQQMCQDAFNIPESSIDHHEIVWIPSMLKASYASSRLATQAFWLSATCRIWDPWSWLAARSWLMPAWRACTTSPRSPAWISCGTISQTKVCLQIVRETT